MKIVIVGCGRVGAVVAEAYDAGGHDVVVVDAETSAFDRLPDAFHGRAVRGDGTDEDVLRRAGAEGADVFLALTEGDNRNVMAAQLAAEALGIGKVIAKINDPVRAAAYADLGIATLCRTGLMLDSINGYLGIPAVRAARDAGADRPSSGSRITNAGRPARRRRRPDARRDRRVAGRRHDVHSGGLSRVRAGRRRRQGRATTSPRSSSRPATRSPSWRRTRAGPGASPTRSARSSSRHDGCEGKYLGEAGANRADVVAAVTGDDEDNLVICQMAKHHFDVPRTIARVNNPKNEALFRHLGVDELISPTRMILGSIEQDIPVHELLHLAALGENELELIEAHLQAGSPAIGRAPRDLAIPDGCSLFAVIRDGVATPLRPDTVMLEGDKVIAIGKQECAGPPPRPAHRRPGDHGAGRRLTVARRHEAADHLDSVIAQHS